MLKTVALLAYMLGNMHGGDHQPLRMISPAFQNGGTIPTEYTCHGKNISLPLRWGGGPIDTKSYAVVMHDVDSSKPMYHWVLYNIPAKVKKLNADDAMAYRDEEQAENSWGQVGYEGPCPSMGTHRYIIRLYALDAIFNLPKKTNAHEFKEAIRGHVLASTRMIGRVKSHVESADVHSH